MKIQNTVKTDEGVFKFNGELSQDEHDLVLTVGLNFLYAQGLIDTMVPNVDVSLMEGSEAIN